MSDNAPERIWAKPEHPDENGYGGFWIKAKVAPSVEYIRLDLYTAVCAERDAAEAEVARLKAALKPFAEAADECDECGFDDFNQAPVTAGDCREARTSLGGGT